jgi:hypothetical protein
MAGITALQSHPASFFGRHGPAEKQFKMQHHLRHVTYDLTASGQGVSLPGLDLTGKITQDWLLRHSTRHKTYRILQGSAGNSPTVDLESLDWSNRTAVVSWMQYHERLHADLDAFFGLKS